MKKEDSNADSRKIATSVEIVDGIPPVTDNEILSKSDVVSEGITKLSDEDLHRLFQFRNLAYIATLSKDGSPHVTPVWVEMEGDLILINTFETSTKNKNITNDKRVALSVVERNNPFNMVSIKGKVIEQLTEGADEQLKGLAKVEDYRQPKVKPEKIMGLSIHPAFYFLAYSPWNKGESDI